MTFYYSRNGITIYCGDCLEVMPQLDEVDCVITDPPYGVDFDTDYTRFNGGVCKHGRNTHVKIANDTQLFDPTPFLNYRKVVLFGANNYSVPPGCLLIWDKRTPNGNKNIMADAEVAWLNSGHGVYIFEHTWDGFNRASEKNTAYHPSQKPVAVMRWVIEKAKPQGVIVDPFMGSGSTLKAAQEMGFPAIGIELSEDYCKIAVDRLRQPSFFSIPDEPQDGPEQLKF